MPRVLEHTILKLPLTLTLTLTMAAICLAFASGAMADDRAKAIIDEMEALYQGDSSRASMTMTVKTPQYERSMSMEGMTLGKEKSFIRILSPRKDRGISTLKLDQEMWNYFPKIDKVIKVPPSMMMGSWMGSDFTNDDLVKQTTLTEEYSLSLEETESEYIITLIPKEETVTVWGKITYTVDREKMIPVSQLFYDDRGELVRRMTFKNPKPFGDLVLPSELEMVPLNKEGHMTIIHYETLEINPGDIGGAQFSLRNLQSRF